VPREWQGVIPISQLILELICPCRVVREGLVARLVAISSDESRHRGIHPNIEQNDVL
jgi:hypothetical protein